MNTPNISPVIMTREIIEDCLTHSPKFRAAVIDNLLVYAKPNLHNELLQLMRDELSQQDTPIIAQTGSMNKIRFIKRIREISTGRVSEFMNAYPAIVSSYHTINIGTMIGLADAKKLAEYYIGTFSK